MNKTESIETLKRRLDALEAEAAELRKALEAPEPVEKKPLLNYDITCDSATFSGVEEAVKKEAEAYAEAINTLLDLRRQPGSEAAVDGKEQWHVNYLGGTESYESLRRKVERISPFFDSRASAIAAVESVGWGRIKRMMDALHGRGYE